MDVHEKMVQSAVTNVLANHEILMANPGGAKLNAFYPSPAESSSTIAQAVDNCGQLVIQANSKQIGGASDFMISTPNILDCPQLNLEFEVKGIPDPAPMVNGVDQRTRAYMCTYHDGWGFDCIDRIEMTVAKSNISNLQLQGHALRDWSLLQCKNADERSQMLKIAGEAKTWTVEKTMKLQASIPISFLFFRTAGGVKGGFGIDGRALHGPITFQIYFKPIQYFCGPAASVYDRASMPDAYDPATDDSEDDPAVRGAVFPASINPVTLLPSEFSRLEFTARTYQLMDGIFSVAKALDANPSLTYSLPSLWLNTYSQEVKLDSEGGGQFNINSIPAGMLQAIIVRIRPTNRTDYLTYDLTESAERDLDPKRTGDYQSMLNYDPPTYGGALARKKALGVSAAGEQTGATYAYRPYVPWSLDIEEMDLEYSGQRIYSARSKASHDNFMRSVFCDDLKTKVCGLPLTQSVVGQKSFSTLGFYTDAPYGARNNMTVTMLENLGDRAMVDHNTQVLVIPLCHDGDGVFRKRDFENLPHYSGSTLQFKFKVAPYNTYSTDGLDRQLCYPDGSQLGTDPDITQDYINQDFFANTERWKPELDGSSCSKLPSNRLQHVAVAKGPNNRQVYTGDWVSPPPDTSAVPTQSRERVLFNNNPNSEGSTAFKKPGGGTVQVDLTYVMATLFQVTNGTSELQL